MRMKTGELRHRISLQEPVATRADNGEQVTTWTTRTTVWAAIWPVKGKEYFSTHQTQSAVTHKVRIWYYSSLDITWRILFNGRYFGIDAIINPDERNKQMELMCIEELYDNRS